MANSIDYGMGLTNIDTTTGIRYGVISMHEVCQAWFDSSEANYGEPHCPVCGNEVKQSTSKQGKDYWCKDCKLAHWSDNVFGDAPQSHTVEDNEYAASQSGDDSDIFILKAPYYTLCEYCSPCAPGAGYLLNEGSVKAYCFGHDWFEDGKAPYKVYSVATGLEVLPDAK